MNKLLLSLTLCLGLSTAAFCQDQPLPEEMKTETVAAISTHTGSIAVMAARPARGDDRPTSQFGLLLADGTVTQVLTPGHSPEQDEIISNILAECLQHGFQGLIVTGPVVRHSNSFGTRDSLVVRRLEILLRSEMGIQQRLVFTFNKE